MRTGLGKWNGVLRLRFKQILYVSCGVIVAGAAVFGVGYHLDHNEKQSKSAFVKYLTDISVSQADRTITNAIPTIRVRFCIDLLPSRI